MPVRQSLLIGHFHFFPFTNKYQLMDKLGNRNGTVSSETTRKRRRNAARSATANAAPISSDNSDEDESLDYEYSGSIIL